MDGLRRCSDSATKQDSKPGRNLVVFLLVANLASYFWETMEIKNAADQKERKEFYGTNLWVVLRYGLAVRSHTVLKQRLILDFLIAVT